MQPTTQHTASDRLINFIKKFEGFCLEAYQDTGGVWTIGYGIIRYKDGTPVKKTDVISQEKADDEFAYAVHQKEYELNRIVADIMLTQNQFDALLSFVYNVGIPAFRDSTLLKKIRLNPGNLTIYTYNPEQPVDSCELLRWVRDGGKVIAGLTNRRKAEADMYAGR